MDKKTAPKRVINNSFYDTLGEDWLYARNHPIALLRAENRARIPWILKIIAQQYPHAKKVLDIGCGVGFLTEALADSDYNAYGIDLSEKTLQLAKQQDANKRISYQLASAYQLPFEDQSFDVVCAMDLLEHVEDPQKVIKEASRTLKNGGLFFFHTFNKNWLSNLVVIHGVKFFVKNAPTNMHVPELFIKPKNLEKMCDSQNLRVQNIIGFNPKWSFKSCFELLLTREVPSSFEFHFNSSLKIGYCGFAKKIS